MFLVAFAYSVSASAQLTVSVSPPSVFAGETLDLVIERQGRGGGEPDLAPLRADFEVLGTSSGREIAFLNGRRTDLRRWQIRLRPRAIGSLTIPSIAVGDAQTPALAFEVRPRPEGAQGGPGDEVFVELWAGEAGAEAGTGAMEGQEPTRVMVQQQLPVIVRLYSARPIRSGRLSDPDVDGAVLQRIASDREFMTERDGQRYQVIERRYSLSPERSGALRIGPVVFEGELVSDQVGGGGASRDAFDLFGRDPMLAQLFGDGPWSSFDRGEPVRAQSATLSLQVDPLPAAASQTDWLPAQDLELNDDWSGNPPSARVGEPLMRTITLVAKGLDANQLPELALPVPSSVRVYSEPPEIETRSDGEHLFGISRQQFTLIPTRAGPLELPAIQLPWWDLEAGRERLASLPAISLSVEGAAVGTDGMAAPSSGSQSSSTGLTPADPILETPSGASSEVVPDSGRVFWLFGGLGVLILGLLLGFGARLLWTSRVHRSGRPIQAGPIARESDLRAALEQACRRHEAAAAARALLAWARVRWPEQSPTNLSQLAERLDAPELCSEVRRLQHCLFAPGSGQWSGTALRAAIARWPVRRCRAERDRVGDLPSLYPVAPNTVHPE